MNLGVEYLGKSQLKVQRTTKEPMTIKEIKAYFESVAIQELPPIIQQYESDTRRGIQKLCEQYTKKHNQYQAKCIRMVGMQEFDKVFANEDQFLAGIDEAGRGPLAGPVVAAAVILPWNTEIIELDDSKKINEETRELLYDEIMEKALSVGIGIISPEIIDDINILQATFRAMELAVSKLEEIPDILLVDGHLEIPTSSTKQHAVIQGDSKSMSIAAASIIAKVTRDRMMREYHEAYPVYDFKSNKGYGSIRHQEAINKHGPCLIHRRSFIKNIQGGN